MGVVVLALFAVGCTADSNDEPAPPTATVPAIPTAAPTATTVPLSVSVELSTDAASYERGEAIALALVVTNTGEEDIELEYASAQRFEIEIAGPEGVVWQWSDGRVFTQATETVVLEPGDALEYEATWAQHDRAGELVEPGAYTATAVITAAAVDETTSVEFVIN